MSHGHLPTWAGSYHRSILNREIVLWFGLVPFSILLNLFLDI